MTHPTPHSASHSATAQFSELFYAALVAAGGAAYLARQAEQNPRAFLAMLSKLLTAELRQHSQGRKAQAGAKHGDLIQLLAGSAPLAGKPQPGPTSASAKRAPAPVLAQPRPQISPQGRDPLPPARVPYVASAALTDLLQLPPHDPATRALPPVGAADVLQVHLDGLPTSRNPQRELACR